jgi:DNA-binding MarR family transcriptional regulator
MQQIPDASDVPGHVLDDAPAAEELAALTLETAPPIMRAIRALMRAGRGDDLSLPQYRALGYVGRHPGASLSAVAEHLGLSTPAASRLIDALVEKGLMARAAAPEDRRYLTLHLSPSGDAIHARTRRQALDGLSALLEGLGPAERATLAQALPILRGLFSSESDHTP